MATAIAPTALASMLGETWRRPGESAHALADSLRALVVNGRVAVRSRVPSERALASELRVSRGSVSRAYDRLRDEGYLASRRGAGSWLTLPDGAGAAVFPTPDDDAIDLTVAALPAPEPAMTQAALAAAEALPRHLHASGYHTAGLPELREAVAARLTQRGVPTTPDEVLITNGAQQAWHLLLMLCVKPGDRVVVDAPAYPRTLSAIGAARARPVPVPLTPTGWDPDAYAATLTAVAPPIAISVADFHNPTGLVMTAAARSAIAVACARSGTLFVADETCAELRFDGPALPPPVAAFDPGATVITIGTMSKAAWGGLRVGWIRATRSLITEIASVRADVDMAGPVLDQLAAVALFERWDDVVADRRALLRERRDALFAALPDRWNARRPHGGLSAWVRLPEPISTALAARAAREGLVVAPGPAFGVDGAFEQHLRLPFTLAPEPLATAVQRLGELGSDLRGAVSPLAATSRPI